jgi:hypothetical protein
VREWDYFSHVAGFCGAALEKNPSGHQVSFRAADNRPLGKNQVPDTFRRTPAGIASVPLEKAAENLGSGSVIS